MADCASASRNPALRTAAGFSDFAAGKYAMNVFTASVLPARRSDSSAFAVDLRYSRFGRDGRDGFFMTASMREPVVRRQAARRRVRLRDVSIGEGGFNPSRGPGGALRAVRSIAQGRGLAAA